MLVASMCSCNQTKTNEVSDTQTSEQAAEVFNGVSYLGMDFSDLSELYGEEYIKDDLTDSYAVRYETLYLPYQFFLSKSSDKIIGVGIFQGGKITDEIIIGMTFDEVEKLALTPIELEFDESAQEYTAHQKWIGYDTYLTFDINRRLSFAIAYKDDFEEPSESFTNKFGDVNTKCVVSGCSNTIAKSGDTNCCESHSNRCGNCNCYIDGDAAFCMSCIENALK